MSILFFIAAGGRRDMQITHIAKSGLDRSRRLGALGLFRIARCILRSGLSLYRRGLISRFALGVALSLTSLIEQSAAILLFGSIRRRARKDDSGTGNGP
jgi:hypothetical protein